MPKIGVLLTNTGTPDAPTSGAVRRYLREFLSDKRVVQLPRLIWLPILYFLILPFRSSRSAALYKKIWMREGSPMRVIMNKLAHQVKDSTSSSNIVIEVGMNYGQPSIASAMQKLQQQQIDRLIVLPLFPQYSNTTTASTFDRVTKALKKWPALPKIIHNNDYAAHPSYIQALANSVQQHWQQHGKSQRLLISFHGLPKRFTEAGDPYAQRCEKTAALLASALDLSDDKWTLCYQSQFGYDKWLQPSTQRLLQELPKQGVDEIDIICPGFSIDCLETLEEIAERGTADFLQAGGKKLQLISCLNENSQHIDLLVNLITDRIENLSPDQLRD